MKSLATLLIALPFITLSPLVAAHADALDLTVDIGSAKQKGDRFSDSDTSVGLTLGYELTSNWSLNLSYTDFGEAQMTSGLLVTGDGEVFDFHSFIETKGLGLSAQYLTDTLWGGWAFGGRFGLMHVDSKMNYFAPDYQDGLLSATKDSDTALTAGLLASYSLTTQMNLIFSADYMAPDAQTTGIGTEDIKTTRFAVGLNYHF
jgi:hypothetical protein